MRDRQTLTKEWIRNRFAIEKAFAKVSRILLSSKPIDLDEVLGIVGTAVSVNKVRILTFKENNKKMVPIHAWKDTLGRHEEKRDKEWDTSICLWLMKRLTLGETVMIANVEDLPIEALAEKEVFRSQDIKSALIIPIRSIKEDFFGAISFENVKTCREWLGEELQTLVIVSELISFYWERKQAKEALDHSEKRYRELYEESKIAEEVYRSLINSSADAIVISDLKGITKYVSPSFTKLFGWTLEEVIGKSIPYIPIMEKKEVTSIYRNIIESKGSCQDLETKRITKDGRVLAVSLSASCYDDHEGKPSGILSILRDISERKKLEAQLIQAQKMEAIGTLAGGIAHDFNNILQAIFGCTEILLLNKNSDNKDYEKLKTIERSARKAGDLTKRLLVFSRKMTSKFVSINLNQEAIQVIAILKRTIPKMISIETNLDEGIRMIDADPVQLEQVMMNLVINARDAMPNGGRIVFQTKNVIMDHDFCSLHPGSIPGEYIMLMISDDGTGMNEETVHHIFEPFFTTKKKGEGTGLGLSMVYGIVKEHGGYITCSSRLSKGTTFKIYFPISKRENAMNNFVDTKEDIQGGNETILFVDDDDVNREIGNEILKNFGYNVIMASDGETAIEYFRQRKEQIDLVILDLIMPGMGGRKCLEELINLDRNVKVIISSGYASSKSSVETIKTGARDFIAKPYDVNRMLKVVRKVLEGK